MTSDNTSAFRKVWSQTDLEVAEDQVQRGAETIAQQRRRIDKIEKNTKEAAQARTVMATMERMQRELIRHRDGIAALVNAGA